MPETSLNIINYWKAIEEFTPSKIEIEKLIGNVKSIQREVLKDQDIPWLNYQDFGHRNSETHVWIYTVFLGIVAIADITKEIVIKLGFAEQLESIKNSEDVSCMCSFQVNLYGQIIPNSLKISDWFTGANSLQKNNALRSKEKITNKIKDLLHNFDDKLNANEQRKQITFSDLKMLVKNCAELADWQSLITDNLLRNSAVIYSSQIKISLKEQAESSADLLDLESGITNSYILSDLEYITDEISSGPDALPACLEQYLRNQQIQKINLYDEKKLFKQFISPAQLPLARWPNNGDHPLNLAQQVAVNLSFLSREGIFSINGPPGTGKSTLLRDIIANIVVQRANILSSFDEVDKAFDKNKRFKHNALNYKVWGLNPKLYGHEIFVASSNNGAVENISAEIPKLASIDAKWHADYFSDIASFVYNKPCWGLGAATLGSKKNRSSYFNKFWSFKPQEGKDTNAIGLEEYLKKNKATCSWVEAREDFLITYNACSKLQQDLIELEQIISVLPSLQIKKLNFNKRQTELEDSTISLEQQIALITIKIDQLSKNVADLKWSVESKTLLKPSWLKRIWGILFGNFHFSQWQSEISAVLCEIKTIQKEINTLEAEKINLAQKCEGENNQLTNNLKISQELDDTLEAYHILVNQYKDQLGACFPDDELWNLPKDQLHQLLPWNYSKLHEMRGELFVKALELHKSFILHASEKLMNNLRVMNLIMKSNNLPAEYNDLLKSVWASFFIVVPVVSSTFSSFANLCSGLGENSIGWVLIDEAGQAPPQAAVGTFWRAKRAVIVGDPMQIKPISTIYNDLDDLFRKFYGISKQWSPLNESVQTISDRNNRYGTFININGDDNWIGCPLLVHRRCAEPMFSVANKIAYDNLMIYATAHSDDNLANFFESSWINVESVTFSNHWSDVEGEAVIALISKIMSAADSLPLIYIISPFKDVASKMRKKLHTNISRWNLKKQPSRVAAAWINDSVGTIHTFQGKEAEIVIILLGGNPRNQGGIDWASKEPNILNVALTRAKKFVFVVGNYATWSKLPYFQELSYALPKVEYHAKVSELEENY